jgi:hypothetical protein
MLQSLPAIESHGAADTAGSVVVTEILEHPSG